MVVPASGELQNRLQDFCNFMDNLHAHIFLCLIFMYNCFMRFLDGHWGWKCFVSFLRMGVRIFRDIWVTYTFFVIREHSSKHHKLAYHFRTYFCKKAAWALLWCVCVGGWIRPFAFQCDWHWGRWNHDANHWVTVSVWTCSHNSWAQYSLEGAIA